MDIRHAVGVKMGITADKLADLLIYRESGRFSERERSALIFASGSPATISRCPKNALCGCRNISRLRRSSS
jgi:hypothetical protein